MSSRSICRALSAATMLGSLLVVHPGEAAAQTRLTLDEALTRARSSPRLVEAAARTDAARATVTSRETQTRPMLSLTSGYLRTNHVDEFGIPQPDGSLRVLFPDIPSNYRLRAEFGMPLYTSGRVRSAVSAAEAEVSAASADERAVRADIDLETTVAYWTLATARARVGVLERAQERAERVVTDAGARVDAGLLPPNERLSADAQRARQRVLLIQAENDAALAEAALARLVGAAPGERLDPATPVTAPAGGAPERMAGGRADRDAIAFRIRSIQEAAHALAAATRPQVNFLAAAEPARPNARFVPRKDAWNTSWDLGIAVNWPLWDGGRGRADRAVLRAQESALTSRLREVDSLVALEIRQRELDLASARASLEAVEQAVAAAAEARRVVGERFSAGVAVTADVLETDVALLEAELERTRIEVAIRLAEARLERARIR